MNSKTILLVFLIIAYFSPPLIAQDNPYRNALFLSAGVTNGSSDNHNTIFGAGYEYRPYPKASFEFTVNSAIDKHSYTGIDYSYNSKTTYAIFTFSVLYYFSESWIQPYTVVGLAVILRSTKAHYESSPHNQSEDEKYQNIYPGINMGAGLKFFLTKNISISPECRAIWGLACESKFTASLNLAYQW